MKYFAIALLSLALGFSANAQSMGASKDSIKGRLPDWQVGMVVTDVIIPALTLDGSFRVVNNHYLGFKLSTPFYQSFNEEDLYNRTNWAFKGGVYHKMFFPLSEQDVLTVRHGVRFGVSELEFDATAWEEYDRFGNTFMEYRDISLSDQPISLGYEALIGWQDNYEYLYFEVYFGLAYEFIQNRSDLLAPEYKGDYYGLDFHGPGYEYDSGIRPVLGLVLGFTDPY